LVLVDYNHLAISNIVPAVVRNGGVVELDMARHMVLNSLRMYRRRFFQDYGELVICCDAKHTWRKDVYPEYKASRKKVRESGAQFDWADVFEALSIVREELIEEFPYKVLLVDGAEADDIIGALVIDA
jgi:5'-3' exonuclease